MGMVNTLESESSGTIYLIHGLWSDGSTWDGIKEELEGYGYEVVIIEYDSYLPYFDYMAIERELEKEMEQRGQSYTDNDVYFIGHSQGGMYLSDNHDIPAESITTINSPMANRGYNYRNDSDILTAGRLGQLDPRIEGRLSGGHGDKPTGEQLIGSMDEKRDDSFWSRLMDTTQYVLTGGLTGGELIMDDDVKRTEPDFEKRTGIISGKKKFRKWKAQNE